MKPEEEESRVLFGAAIKAVAEAHTALNKSLKDLVDRSMVSDGPINHLATDIRKAQRLVSKAEGCCMRANLSVETIYSGIAFTTEPEKPYDYS